MYFWSVRRIICVGIGIISYFTPHTLYIYGVKFTKRVQRRNTVVFAAPERDPYWRSLNLKKSNTLTHT